MNKLVEVDRRTVTVQAGMRLRDLIRILAERDLELRGPGAVFGTQQHGLSDLQFLAVVLQAPHLLDQARNAAHELMEDPLSRERLRARLAAMQGKWRRRLDLAQVG